MRQTCHENRAHFLRERLNSDRYTRGRTTGEHDDTVFLDHPLSRSPCSIRLGLSIASHEVNFLSEDTVTLQIHWLHGLHHAAVTFTVEVFDSKFKSTQFVRTFVRVGSGLRNVEANSDGRFIGRVVSEPVATRVGTLNPKCWGAECCSCSN